MNPSKHIEKWRRAAGLAGFVAAVILMAAAGRGDLWFDEIVSVQRALTAQSWGELLTQDQTDNNHLLNTFFLRLIGEQRNLYLYRIPAILFGAATIAMLAVSARRWGKTASGWVIVLAGFSYPLILYFSEARGYAPAMFFAVAAYELFQRCRERCGLARLFLLWTMVCLGFLSHFSFIIVATALGGWLLITEFSGGASIRVVFSQAVKFFAVPLFFVGGLYWIYIRHMTYLGGHIVNWWEIAGSTAEHALGFPETAGLRFVAIGVAVLVGCGGGLMLSRQQRSEAIFFPLVLLVCPVLLVVFQRPQFLQFRYFIVCFPFFYLLLALVFSEWFGSSGFKKLLPVILAAAMTAGHLIKIQKLLSVGRGNYRTAMAAMAAATDDPVIQVGSDHDFRNKILLEFYARYLPPAKRLRYVVHTDYGLAKPDWIIVHTLDPDLPAYPDVEVDGLGRYDYFGRYPYCGQSGWCWFVYRATAGLGK